MNLCYEIKKLDFCFFGCDGLTAPFKNVRTGFLLCRNHFFLPPADRVEFPAARWQLLADAFRVYKFKKKVLPLNFFGEKNLENEKKKVDNQLKD
jgi:hypothetical protein